MHCFRRCGKFSLFVEDNGGHLTPIIYFDRMIKTVSACVCSGASVRDPYSLALCVWAAFKPGDHRHRSGSVAKGCCWSCDLPHSIYGRPLLPVTPSRCTSHGGPPAKTLPPPQELRLSPWILYGRGGAGSAIERWSEAPSPTLIEHAVGGIGRHRFCFRQGTHAMMAVP